MIDASDIFSADGRDFERIGRAIALLAEHWREQPSLGWIAAEVGLSEFHLQRLFSRWAGVSPKRFVQFLTKEAARACLVEASSLLDASLACGLSGSSRLHDLFVRYEGMSPGEFKAAVAGRPMAWGEVETPFGNALAIFAPRGLHRLDFFAGVVQRDALLAEAHAAYPEACWARCAAERLRLLQEAFRRRGAGAPLELCVVGSAFQLKVWEALLAVPPGRAVTYGGLAAALGMPGAARAVGNAVAANAVAALIPCHRVIRESGAIGGYRWGSARKQAMLGWERARLGA